MSRTRKRRSSDVGAPRAARPQHRSRQTRPRGGFCFFWFAHRVDSFFDAVPDSGNSTHLDSPAVNLLRTGLVIATLTPSIAEASGGEVLSLLWLEWALFVVVATSIALGRLSMRGKLLVGGAYLMSAIAPLVLTFDWPYRDNQRLINALCIGTPFLSWLAAFIYSRKWFRRVDE